MPGSIGPSSVFKCLNSARTQRFLDHCHVAHMFSPSALASFAFNVLLFFFAQAIDHSLIYR